MAVNQKIIASITEDLNTFFSENSEYTKKELETFMTTAVKNAYDSANSGGKAPRKSLTAKKPKEDKQKEEKSKEDKPKRELTAYQVFMKEQMTILKAREDAKGDDEVKIKPKELMKEIGELWKASKE